MSTRMLVTECFDGKHATCKGYNGPAANPNFQCACDCHSKSPQMDWQQVALNGGPPCFFVEGPQYCGRAERWPGHGNEAFHNFVSLGDLLATARKEAFKEAAEKVHAMSRIDAKDKSRDFLAGAAWLQNKAALMLATLSVEAATTDTDTTERG